MNLGHLVQFGISANSLVAQSGEHQPIGLHHCVRYLEEKTRAHEKTQHPLLQ